MEESDAYYQMYAACGNTLDWLSNAVIDVIFREDFYTGVEHIAVYKVGRRVLFAACGQSASRAVQFRCAWPCGVCVADRAQGRSHEEGIVSVTSGRSTPRPLHPGHAFFLAAAVPLFAGAALSDCAYMKSYEIQWANFASWLIAGGLAFSAVALVCALIGLIHPERRNGRSLVYLLLLLALWILGFINALVHARDAWASMPTGLVLSVIVTALACVAAWVGFSSLRVGGTT